MSPVTFVQIVLLGVTLAAAIGVMWLVWKKGPSVIATVRKKFVTDVAKEVANRLAEKPEAREKILDDAKDRNGHDQTG